MIARSHSEIDFDICFLVTSLISKNIETGDIAKIIKMGSFHSSQKWSVNAYNEMYSYNLIYKKDVSVVTWLHV